MKKALLTLGYVVASVLLSFVAGYDTGKRNADPPPVCSSICTPYTEQAALAEDAAQRCDHALLSCLSWQVVTGQELAEMKVAFISFKNAITGCVQQ